MDWHKATAEELGRGIGAGTIDPVELTDSFLATAADHPEGSRIYARLTPHRARAEALAARDRARNGLRRGPLDGVPLSWKDLYDSAGVATEAGTAMMADRVPDRDAAVLANATAAGTICLGKTHMSEIAFSGLGYNPVTATAPNINDSRWLPGGSSSGAAASVAFGLAPAAVGSDTGGSIRLPAAWSDLVGYKPTHGTLPLDGVVPLCASFDTVGPLCRSVGDAALVTAALGGWKPVDLAGATLQGVRFLILDTVVGEDVDEAPARGFAQAVDRLAAAGARIDHGAFPALSRAYDLTGALYGAESWAFWRPHVQARGDLMYHQIRDRVSAGDAVKAADFIAGWAELRALRQDFAAFAAGYDAVLCPTVPILPPETARVAADGEYYRAANLRALRNTRMGNLMGLCGVSLPTGVPSCGILLNGLAGRDGHLLRIAQAAAQALA
jgi:aspartyl-tRNA(Asn)/glutamyl-tRNA(Gln) amidotransferase subunit A